MPRLRNIPESVKQSSLELRGGAQRTTQRHGLPVQSTPRQRSLEGKLLLITGDNWTGRFPMEAQGEHRCLVLITVQTQGGKSPSLHPTGIIQAGAGGTQLRGAGSPPGFQHRKPHCSVLGKVPKIQQRGQRREGSRARAAPVTAAITARQGGPSFKTFGKDLEVTKASIRFPNSYGTPS